MKKLLLIFALILSGCSAYPVKFTPDDAELSPSFNKKVTLPEPQQGKVIVAVYSFTDKTGQRKDSASIAKLSSAVTQGGEAILLKSLEDAGDGKWFRIVERVGLDNLLKERQLIRSARDEAKDPTGIRPILYAGMILEGAIVSYDTNTKTGGFGVRYMGIGPSTQYQEDTVTVSLRVVSTQTGEVLMTINTQKTVLSYSTTVSTFVFFKDGTQAFENEIGMSKTEPGILALKAAVDMAVEQMIIQGEKKNLWKFKQKEEIKNEN